VSLKAITWVMERAPVKSPAEQVVLYVLADRAHDDGRCAWPAQSWIAERTRLSTRTVRRHLSEMEARGLIRRGDQRPVQHIPPQRRPIVWDLCMSGPDNGDRSSLTGQNDRPDNGDRSGPDNGDRSGPDTGVLQTVLKNHPVEPPNTPCSPPEGDGGFREFWDTYPRHVGRPKALAAFNRAVKRAGGPGPILDGVRRLATDPNLPTEKQFIPHPTTWLNRDGWDDDPLPPRLQTGEPGTGHAFGTRPEDWLQGFTPTPDENIVEGEVLSWPEIEP
jgi:hypothetical protein